jgi:hypothetical protein
MKLIAALGLFALITPLAVTPALAQSDEAIRTRQLPRGAPVAEPGSALEQYRRLPDALDDNEAVVVRRRCAGPDDGKPHGEVHVGVGSGGYKETGATVCKAFANGAEAQVSVDIAEGGRTGYYRGRRGR